MMGLPARTGIEWIGNGLALLRKKPFFLTNLFFGYLLAMIVLSMLPLLGPVLPILVAPVFTFLFMNATRHLENGDEVGYRGFFDVLDCTTTLRLVMVGAVYLVFAVAATGLSFLVDGGTLFNLFARQGAQTPVEGSGATFLAMGLILVLYLPFAMATWFAAPLIGWQKMTLGKALFFSFFTVIKHIRAFILYMMAWFLGFVSLNLATAILAGLVGAAIASVLAFMVSVIASIWMYCSFYPTYRDIFGRPDSNR